MLQPHYYITNLVLYPSCFWLGGNCISVLPQITQALYIFIGYITVYFCFVNVGDGCGDRLHSFRLYLDWYYDTTVCTTLRILSRPHTSTYIHTIHACFSATYIIIVIGHKGRDERFAVVLK